VAAYSTSGAGTLRTEGGKVWQRLTTPSDVPSVEPSKWRLADWIEARAPAWKDARRYRRGDVVMVESRTISAGTTTLTGFIVQEVLEWSYALSFNGSNNFLTTGITTGNEGWVCAGVTALSNATTQTLIVNGAGDATAKGIWIARVAGGNTWNFSLSDGLGGVRQTVSTTSAAPNIPTVQDFGWNGTTVIASSNGTETTAAQTKNVAHTTPLSIGGGVYSFWFNGPMTATVICPVLPSAADRALIRRFVGALQGQLVGLGPELVVNGGFDTDSGWTKGANWTISSGVASKAEGATGQQMDAAVSLIANKPYQIRFKVSNAALAGGASATVRSVDSGGTMYVLGSLAANGEFSATVTPTISTATIRLVVNEIGSSATFDDVSIREVGL
jgi:hypothetical protein